LSFSMNDIEKHSATCDDLQRLIKYNLSFLWGAQKSKCPTFASLANLAVCSKEAIIALIEALDAIQVHIPPVALPTPFLKRSNCRLKAPAAFLRCTSSVRCLTQTKRCSRSC
jgi:hypothetical protein